MATAPGLATGAWTKYVRGPGAWGRDMAEGGLIEDVPGGEGEEARAASAPGADAFAAAIAMDEARRDPELARKAGDYLDRHSRLIALQIEHFEEDNRLATQAAKRKRFSDRLKNALQVFLALAATVGGLGLLVMLHDDLTSRRVVVDAFKGPAAFAARGLTGEVLAAGLLDQLQKLQDATRSARKGLSTTSAWSSDIKVEAPGTGVSIGDIDRLVRARFGHDVHIGGDVVQAETGEVALTVRGDGVPAKTFQGPAADLDKLAAQAAEYVYGRSQPFQFATYLTSNGRDAEAAAFLPGALARAASDHERAELANVWGNAYVNLNNQALAVQKYRLAMALEPTNWKFWGNLVGAAELDEGEEAGWREGQAMLRAVAKGPKDKRPELRLLINPATTSFDLPLMLASNLDDASRNGGAGAKTSIDGPAIADNYALMHDPASAARYMASSDPEDSTTRAEALLLAGYAALDRGDPAAAVAPLEAFWKAWQANPSLQAAYFDTPCFLGLAYGLTGRMAQAEAVFKRTGAWSRCYAVHGDALERSGDLAGAERVWAQGIAVGPDLPSVYLHRGLSELKRGELARARADLAAAHARSPHWADPLEGWGEALAREGRWRAALARYDEALKYAPAWKELRQARETAAKRGQAAAVSRR
ncbi:MAG TPA: hypothetical protein VII63_01070 [Caulobacteraceae bacterium]